MSYPHRPSILHRGVRAPHPMANEETYESQYAREQALLHAKQERQLETRDRLLRSLAPGPDDKRRAMEEMVEANSQLAGQRHGDYHRSYEAPQLPSPSSGAGPLPEGVQPWHHATTTQQYSLAEEEAARRRFAAEVAAENQRLARERDAVRLMEEQARRQPPQDSWYSRGDTHRPVAPLFSGNGVAFPTVPPPQQRSPPAYPWAPSTGDAEVVVSRPQSAQPQPKMPERQYPWTWQAQ
ncbi:hypothetical protein TSOC_000122 [Tetrabaena socialis]|uniref:Uncharacterized protein n=1 Tax=Tetrabaena socialis TaxID=47790 RepID=A0A2J8AK32_9CHLO|nr:hypothetical protein TSOC_000122 [Tetrabaena socialis]|eukprot:PNH12868.1 hypothetical protein TSOC_000122 [Tetrabaena socialis]